MDTIKKNGGDVVANNHRLLAGFFVGLTSILLIGGGVYSAIQGASETGFALIASGSTPLGTLLGFFVGESNEAKKHE